MNPREFRLALIARVREAKEKRIWDKALFIAETFGERRQIWIAPYTTKADYFFTVTIAGQELNLHRSRHTYGERFVMVRVNRKLVFSANETLGHPDDQREFGKMTTMRLDNGIRVAIHTYIPGEWEEWLVPDRIKRALADMRKRLAQEAERAAQERARELAKRENSRTILTCDELHIAERFGIAV